jgi:TolA-binding protein
MEIRKLKKSLLKAELKRQRSRSKKHRWLVRGTACLLTLLIAGGIGYYLNIDKLLVKDFARAEALVEQGEYQRAADSFRSLYDRHPGFARAPEALFQSGEIQNLYLKRYHEALLAYLLVEKDYPESEFFRRAQAQVADIYKNRLRDYSRSIVAYQKLLDGGTQDLDSVQYEVADIYFRLNNFEQARIEFESLLKNYPESSLVPEVQYRIGVAYSLEEAPAEAEAAFRAVIKEWPDSSYAVEARYGLAAVLEDQEHLRLALQVLEDLQGVYPNEEALAQRTEQVRERIRKKKKAI